MEDHKFLTLPFGLNPGSQPKNITTSSYYINNSNQFNAVKLRASRKSISSDSTVIFAKNYNQYRGRGTSRDLVAVIILTSICCLMEGFIMFDKHHFCNLLVFFCIFSIFLFNYFDKYYMMFLLVVIGLSLLMDFAWLLT